MHQKCSKFGDKSKPSAQKANVNEPLWGQMKTCENKKQINEVVNEVSYLGGHFSSRVARNTITQKNKTSEYKPPSRLVSLPLELLEML